MKYKNCVIYKFFFKPLNIQLHRNGRPRATVTNGKTGAGMVGQVNSEFVDTRYEKKKVSFKICSP